MFFRTNKVHNFVNGIRNQEKIDKYKIKDAE